MKVSYGCTQKPVMEVSCGGAPWLNPYLPASRLLAREDRRNFRTVLS